MSNFKKIDDYHIRNGDWTICKTGITTVKYGLWQGAFNRGWFNSSKEAIIEYERIMNDRLANGSTEYTETYPIDDSE